jgi:c-di-GMP-binding flagellar brake protein YcgR
MENRFRMDKNPAKPERRSAPRFHAKDGGEIVVFPHGVISYKLVDISETGLGFCYAATEDHGWIDSSCSIDLVGKNFSLEGIPAKIVSDRYHTPLRITENGIVPSLRRVGVQFVHLSSEQQKSLKRYLMPHKKASVLSAMTAQPF